jgi:hypothetical protein
MLAECTCYERQCKWYVGIIQPDGTEMTETNMCGAFPDGIPDEIAYGDNKHDKELEGQTKPYVYEKDTDWDNHWDNLPQEDLDLFDEINSGGTEE